jgi:acyl-CoA hydrolase
MENEVKPKSIKSSQTTITELMIPSYANFGGKIHGGIILSLMDKVAYACSAKHASGYCVTVAIDNVAFKAPVNVGELVHLKASVNYVGNSSMVIGIRVDTENVETGEIKHTNTSYFTMVAKDKEGNPRQVPPLLLESVEEIRRFMEAIKRRELKELYKDEFDNKKNVLKVGENIRMLDNERCVIVMK